jgi:hypothetical protein
MIGYRDLIDPECSFHFNGKQIPGYKNEWSCVDHVAEVTAIVLVQNKLVKDPSTV